MKNNKEKKEEEEEERRWAALKNSSGVVEGMEKKRAPRMEEKVAVNDDDVCRMTAAMDADEAVETTITGTLGNDKEEEKNCDARETLEGSEGSAAAVAAALVTDNEGETEDLSCRVARLPVAHVGIDVDDVEESYDDDRKRSAAASQSHGAQHEPCKKGAQEEEQQKEQEAAFTSTSAAAVASSSAATAATSWSDRRKSSVRKDEGLERRIDEDEKKNGRIWGGKRRRRGRTSKQCGECGTKISSDGCDCKDMDIKKLKDEEREIRRSFVLQYGRATVPPSDQLVEETPPSPHIPRAFTPSISNIEPGVARVGQHRPGSSSATHVRHTTVGVITPQEAQRLQQQFQHDLVLLRRQEPLPIQSPPTLPAIPQQHHRHQEYDTLPLPLQSSSSTTSSIMSTPSRLFRTLHRTIPSFASSISGMFDTTPNINNNNNNNYNDERNHSSSFSSSSDYDNDDDNNINNNNTSMTGRPGAYFVRGRAYGAFPAWGRRPPPQRLRQQQQQQQPTATTPTFRNRLNDRLNGPTTTRRIRRRIGRRRGNDGDDDMECDMYDDVDVDGNGRGNTEQPDENQDSNDDDDEEDIVEAMAVTDAEAIVYATSVERFPEEGPRRDPCVDDDDDGSDEHTKDGDSSGSRAEYHPCKDWRVQIGTCILLAVVVALSVGLSVSLKSSQGGGNENEMDASSSSSTANSGGDNENNGARNAVLEWCTGRNGNSSTTTTTHPPNTSQRYENLTDFLSGSDRKMEEEELEDVTQTPCTVREKAMYWLADIDSRNLSISESNRDAIVQRYTMAVLYFGTGGSYWHSSIGWLSGENECEWQDLTCDNEGTTGLVLTEISLKDNNLTGMMPIEIGSLTELGVLCLSKNNLNGTIPEAVGDLTSLTELDLCENKMTGPIPSVIGQLTLLDTLILAKNRLNGTIPGEIGSLTHLEVLNLSNNSLVGTIPGNISALTKLEQLLLADNMLEGTFPTEIEELTGLVELDLSNNNMNGTVPLSFFEKFDNLRYLNLSGNAFFIPDHFCSHVSNDTEVYVDCEEPVCPCCKKC